MAAVVVFVFAVIVAGAGVVRVAFGVGEVMLEDLLGGFAFVAGGEWDAQFVEALLRPGPHASGEDQIDAHGFEPVGE